MSDTLYDIYITGKLKAGVDSQQARTRLASLFKISEQKAAALVCGKPQLIKKGLDKAAAQRYLKILQQAGLETAARKAESATAPAAGSEQAESRGKQPTSPAPARLELAPEGTPVLKEEERHVIQPVEIDTSALKLASPFTEAAATAPTVEAVNAPDFGLAPPGSLLEQLPSNALPVNPDTSAMSLAEPGSDLGQIPRTPPPPPPETDHLRLAGD